MWPEAAEQARRRLRSGFGRRGFAEEIRFLLVPGSLRITARGGPDGGPLPFVLVTATGPSGTPVAKLYDFRVDLDANGRGEVPGIPARHGSYSVRLHTEREFRSAEGFDLVWVGDVRLWPGETTTIDATLVPGGRVRVASPLAADIRIVREGHQTVAATFWRGDAGGFTTQAFRLTPGFLSCPLPPGRTAPNCASPRYTLRGDADFVIRAGELTEVVIPPPR